MVHKSFFLATSAKTYLPVENRDIQLKRCLEDSQDNSPHIHFSNGIIENAFCVGSRQKGLGHEERALANREIIGWSPQKFYPSGLKGDLALALDTGSI